MEVGMTGLGKQVDLMRNEDDLDLDLPGLKVDSEMYDSDMSEEKDNTPTMEKSSKL